jgi:monofunctional biosynthetic peptidoglycan transglycosylase
VALVVLGTTILLVCAAVVGLRWIDPPSTSIMIRERFAGTGHQVEYDWVDWPQISPHLALAVIAAEDQRFPTHAGIDLEAVLDALESNLDGGEVRGGSTITQQVAKNLFLWHGRSYVRKVIEAPLAILIDALLPKRRILEIYLNIAEMGPGVFGAEAAAQRHFKRPASALTQTQAAAIAAVLPSPKRFSVTAPSRYVRGRQRWILDQMRALGGIGYLDTLISN